MAGSKNKTMLANLLLVMIIIYLTLIKQQCPNEQRNIYEPLHIRKPFDDGKDPISESLITEIRKEIHFPTAGQQLAFKHPKAKYFSQFGQDKTIDNILGARKNGFFVECGAGNGEWLSNTAFFERERGWTGLLIEADPRTFKNLEAKNRSAYLVSNCLSLENKPTKMTFQQAAINYVGGLVEGFESQHAAYLKETKQLMKQIDLICYPLQALLRAVNRTHVDYFSLDVEGPELKILQNFPWDRFTIDTITVEFRVLKPDNHSLAVDHYESAKKFHRIKDYMLGTGLYDMVGVLPNKTVPEEALDLAFVRKGLT